MRKKENEKGAALILVLGALAALTVFAGAFALLTFTASYESAVWRDSSALEVAARAGLEYCIWAIKSSELYAYEFYEYAGPAPGPVQAYPKDSEIYYKAYNFLAPPPSEEEQKWERRYLYYGFDFRDVYPSASTSASGTAPVRISFQKHGITNIAYADTTQSADDYYSSEVETPTDYNDMHRILDFNLGRTAAGKEQRVWVYAKIVDNESRLNINTAGNKGMVDDLNNADSAAGQNIGFTASELTPEYVRDNAALPDSLKRMLVGRWWMPVDANQLTFASSPIWACKDYPGSKISWVPGLKDDSLLPTGMKDDNMNSTKWSDPSASPALDLIDNDGDGLVDETSLVDGEGYKEGVNEALEANLQYPFNSSGAKVDSLFGERSEMELIRNTGYISRAEAVDVDGSGNSTDNWWRSVTAWSFDTVVAAQARVYSGDYSSFGGPGTYKMDLYNSTFTEANPDNRQEFAQRLFWVLVDVLRRDYSTGQHTSPRYKAGSLLASFIDYVDNDDFADINYYSDFTVTLVSDSDGTAYSNIDRTIPPIGGVTYRLGTTWTGSNAPAAVVTDVGTNPSLYQTGIEKTPAITEVYYRDPDGTPGNGDEVWDVEIYNPHEFSIRVRNWNIYLKDGAGATLATHTIPPAALDMASNSFYTASAIAHSGTVDSVVLADATFDYAVDIFDANGIGLVTGRERLNWADPSGTGASDGTLGDQPATPYTLSNADVDGFRWNPYGTYFTPPPTTASDPVRLLSQFVAYMKETICFSYPHATQVNATNKESLLHKLQWSAPPDSKFGDNLKIYEEVKGVLGGLTVWSPMEDGYDNDADGTKDGFDWLSDDPTHAKWPPEAFVFGKININTASKEVLKAIPIPNNIDFATYGISPDTLADDIINARRGATLPAGHPFKDVERPFVGPWDVFDGDFLNITASIALDSTKDHMLRAAIAGVVTYRSCNYTVHIVARLVEYDPEVGPGFFEVAKTELVAGVDRTPRLLQNLDHHMLEAFKLTAAEQEQLRTKLAITGRPISVRFMQWIKE